MRLPTCCRIWTAPAYRWPRAPAKPTQDRFVSNCAARRRSAFATCEADQDGGSRGSDRRRRAGCPGQVAAPTFIAAVVRHRVGAACRPDEVRPEGFDGLLHEQEASAWLTGPPLVVRAGVDSYLRTRLSCRWPAPLPDCKAMEAFDEEQRAFNGSPLDDENLLSGQFWGELRVFLAVAKTKSFNRAAEITNTSQPTSEPAGQAAAGRGRLPALHCHRSWGQADPKGRGARASPVPAGSHALIRSPAT